MTNKIKPDKYQNKVIKSKAKNILVIAGAGSGKTQTIVMKIRKLINERINPEEILCISFTRESSQNLEKKLKTIGVSVKTFHSLGYEIISKYRTVKIVTNELDKIIDKEIKENKNINKILDLNFKRIGSNDNVFNLLENNIIINSKYKNQLALTIQNFINLYKSSNMQKEDYKLFYRINEKNNIYEEKKRHKYFLKLTQKVLKKYEKFLKKNNYIDYNDMINEATKIVEKKFTGKYKYIIVDEYQDISLNKVKLIKEIQNKTNAKLIALGDDWQSIYTFTGSNLEVFTKFKKIFKHSKTIKLKYTYRNSKELTKVAGKFISKNPFQITKKIKTSKTNKYPIHIYYYNKSIEEVWEKIREEVKNTETLILSRNNRDINLLPKLDKNMKFLTMHKSKGLESDNTIIINLEDSYSSIPSKIKENEFLNYVKPQTEKFKYAEERRLFYVALTRCKNNNYLIVKKDNPSVFVKELLKDSRRYIDVK